MGPKPSLGTQLPPSPPRSAAMQGTTTLQLRRALLGAVLGPGGRVIRELEASTQTRIKISECRGERRSLEVTGEPVAVGLACELIRELAAA